MFYSVCDGRTSCRPVAGKPTICVKSRKSVRHYSVRGWDERSLHIDLLLAISGDAEVQSICRDLFCLYVLGRE